jgi:hypothetical protein
MQEGGLLPAEEALRREVVDTEWWDLGPEVRHHYTIYIFSQIHTQYRSQSDKGADDGGGVKQVFEEVGGEELWRQMNIP